jgi:hypothetical protein
MLDAAKGRDALIEHLVSAVAIADELGDGAMQVGMLRPDAD